MAVTVTLGSSLGDSANSQTYLSTAFTPAVGDLLVVFTSATGTVTQAATMTGTGAGLTFTKVTHALRAASTDISHCFIANQLVTVAASQTVTTDFLVGDPATGCCTTVLRLNGTMVAGLAAVVQSAKSENGAAAGTPAPVFGATTNTNNTILGHVGNNTNPATMTAPATFTETSDNGNTGPLNGNEVAHVITGFAATTVTWGSTSATTYGALIVEIDGVADLRAQSIM